MSDRVRLSHPDKVLFPDDGITKAELAAYYQAVAAPMLVRGRPVTMQRFPNGIGRGGFLQKQIGDYFPGWIERVTAPNRRTRQGTTREQVTTWSAEAPTTSSTWPIRPASPPHVWLSRAPDIYRPDQLVFDLDPASPTRGCCGWRRQRCTGCSTSSTSRRTSSPAGRAACT